MMKRRIEIPDELIPKHTMKEIEEKYKGTKDYKFWENYACFVEWSDWIKELKHKEQKGKCLICNEDIDLKLTWHDTKKWYAVLHHLTYEHKCLSNSYAHNGLGNDFCKKAYYEYIPDQIKKNWQVVSVGSLFGDEDIEENIKKEIDQVRDQYCHKCFKNLVLLHADCHSKLHQKQAKIYHEKWKGLNNVSDFR